MKNSSGLFYLDVGIEIEGKRLVRRKGRENSGGKVRILDDYHSKIRAVVFSMWKNQGSKFQESHIKNIQ